MVEQLFVFVDKCVTWGLYTARHKGTRWLEEDAVEGSARCNDELLTIRTKRNSRRTGLDGDKLSVSCER
jgi:hypothetical protein